METSIAVFVLYITIAFVLGSLVGYFFHSGLRNIKSRIKKCGLNFRDKLVDYWYVIVFIAATIFVFIHFKECIDLSFTDDFNGMNLIFLFWLALLIFPMFESFEGFGISIKKRKLDKEKESVTADFHAQIKSVQARKEAEHE